MVSYTSTYNQQAQAVYKSAGVSISYASGGQEKLCCGRGCGSMCVRS